MSKISKPDDSGLSKITYGGTHTGFIYKNDTGTYAAHDANGVKLSDSQPMNLALKAVYANYKGAK